MHRDAHQRLLIGVLKDTQEVMIQRLVGPLSQGRHLGQQLGHDRIRGRVRFHPRLSPLRPVVHSDLFIGAATTALYERLYNL